MDLMCEKYGRPKMRKNDAGLWASADFDFTGRFGAAY